MKTIIIDNSKDDVAIEELRKTIDRKAKMAGDEIVTINRTDTNVRPCLACNACWVKSPGICKINDDAIYLSKLYYKSDLIIFISHLQLGAYSSYIKRILERLIPNILPFFEVRDKKMYHSLRNKKYPLALFVGIVENEEQREREEKFFRKLVRMNTMNMAARSDYHYFLVDKELENYDQLIEIIENLSNENGINIC